MAVDRKEVLNTADGQDPVTGDSPDEEIVKYLTSHSSGVQEIIDPPLDITFIPFVTPRIEAAKAWLSQSHQIHPDIDISGYRGEEQVQAQSRESQTVPPLGQLSKNILNPIRALRLATAALTHL